MRRSLEGQGAARRALIRIAVCLVAMSLVGCAREPRFPDQPISLICPWSAGGGTDRVARQLAAQLETQLGVPVNVINATGGGGVTGHTRGAVARPDGYTLTMITVELSMLHWRGLTNVTHEDFAPLKLLNRDAAALFVRGDSPYQSLGDLQAAASLAGAGKLKASGTAYGGIWHIAVAGWLDSRGLAADAVNWISINGAGPSIQELLAGGVDFICCSLPEADAVLAGGQVRCLGVMADERIAGFDNVPTFKQQGHDWSLAGWRGLAAPRDTPPQRLRVISDAVDRVTQSEAFTGFMAASGFDLSLEGPTEFAQTLKRQDLLFGGILTSEAFSQVSGEHFGPMMFPAAIAVALALALLLVVREIRRGEVVPGLMSGVPTAAQFAADLGTPTEAAEGGRKPSAYGSSTRRSDDTADRPGGDQTESNYLYPAAVLFAVAFYWIASEPLGFVATAILMLAGLLLAFGARPPVAVSVAVVAGLATYQVFGVLLRVPLPRGFLEW